jgi:hypothetical protein
MAGKVRGRAGVSRMSELLRMFDSELEAVVLGTILQDGEPAYRQVAFLEPDDFAEQKHKVVFTAITGLAAEIDPTVGEVAHMLRDQDRLSSVDGLAGLMSIEQRGISGVPLAGFAKSLRRMAIDRRACRLSAKLQKSLELGFTANSSEVAEIAEELRALEQGTISSGAVERIEDLPGVCDNTEQVTYIRDPEIVAGTVTALTGDSGSGKSTLATAWVRDAIANGIPALILDRESPRSAAADRMRRLGLEDSTLLRWWGGWLDSVPGPASPQVRAWVDSCSTKPIVIVDSLAGFFEGNENDASDMRKFMNASRHLADRGASVIVLHHDGKSETARDYRGSSDFKANFDQAFHMSNLTSDGMLDRMTLRCFKSRYGFVGSLVYRYAGGKFIRDQARDAVVITQTDQLKALLRQNPGVTITAFDALTAKHGLARNRARDFLTNSLLEGSVRREKGAKHTHHYYLVSGGDLEAENG